MNVYENRLASFNDNVKWPYSKAKKLKANPETLAHAGFYYTPTRILPPNDNVTCFSCAKQLDGWQSNDDPFAEHASHSPTCAWCVLGFPAPPQAGSKKKKPVHVHPRLTVDAADPKTWPASERMVEARLASFGSSWPHEGRTGWSAVSVQKMASAGFHYTPTPDADDEAACVYCGLHLDGWAKEDDPIQEHQKREPTCPFFINFASLTITATAAAPSATLVTAPATKQGGKPAKAPRGRRKKVGEEEATDREADTQTDAGSETMAETEEGGESEREARPARGKKKAGAGRRRGRQPKGEQRMVTAEGEAEMEGNTITDVMNTKKFLLDGDDAVSIADTDTESIAPPLLSPINNGKKRKATRPTRRMPDHDKLAVVETNDPTGPVGASARRESVGSEISVTTLAESVVNEATEPARRGRRPGRGAARGGARVRSETKAQDVHIVDAAEVDKMTEWDKDPMSPDRGSFRPLPTLPATATTTTIPPLLAQCIEPILSTTLTRSAPSQPIIITDEEWNMTVEEYMDRLVEKQVERLNEEARRMMGVFVGEAEKIARAIGEGK
ncbi:hypothetical protein BC937DRAFT_87102 [Endogone sp. FLAS-F59071]|nr:hypothetical protein BC937DRAFT_87102 [Endogone sp. FLAS-F59071]|eukprot:RUS19684.1 hypothetical protein BC937DRAFT_87102 [Endogone sp. FLAS-F59071]